MAKTNPIGVRFRTEILDFIKENIGADTPQQALVFMENFYRQHHEKVSILDSLRDAPPTEDFKVKYEAIAGALEELKAAMRETIPDARNKSAMGQKSWQMEKDAKIIYICKKLVNLK